MPETEDGGLTQTLFFNELDQEVNPEDAVKMVRLTLDDEGRVIDSLVAYAEPESMTEVGTDKSGSVGSSAGDKMTTFPNIYFGDKEARLVDWRKVLPEEVDPDDEDLGPASKELIDWLGVDPDELFKEEGEKQWWVINQRFKGTW